MSEHGTEITAPAQGTTGLPNRANWKGHEHRAELMFFGNDKTPWPNGIKVAARMDGNMLSLSGEFVDGHREVRIGAAGKFWAAPVPARITHDEVRHSSDGDAIAVIDGTREDCANCTPRCSVCGLPNPLGTDSHESSENCCGDPECGACNGGNGGPAGHLDKQSARSLDGTCRCGCGQKVGKRSIFRQGHDAKMVSKLVERVRSGDLAPDMAIGAAALVSDALAYKTRRAVENAVSKLAKKASK